MNAAVRNLSISVVAPVGMSDEQLIEAIQAKFDLAATEEGAILEDAGNSGEDAVAQAALSSKITLSTVTAAS